MKILSLITLLGLMVSGTAMAADYSVAIVVDHGINLYSITENGVALVRGSPFVPHPLPISQTEQGPDRFPAYIAMNPAHNFVYALYEFAAGLATLVGFEVTEHGLVQAWETPVAGIGELGGEHYPSINGITAARDYATLSVYSEETNPANYFGARVFNQAGQQVFSTTGVVVDNGDGGYLGFLGMQIDPSGLFFYDCLQNVSSPYDTAVYVYGLEPGLFLGFRGTPPAPKLLKISTDPIFFQSQCGYPPVAPL